MTKFIKVSIFLFCLLVTTMVFSRSSTWFETTTGHMISNTCNKGCKTRILEGEIDQSVLLLIKSLLGELQHQLDEKSKKRLWEK